MRDCNNCVYFTRDGGCRKFTCEGTKTVEDIRADALDEFAKAIRENSSECYVDCDPYFGSTDLVFKTDLCLDDILEQLKEQKNE